jgi:hypothetical protein
LVVPVRDGVLRVRDGVLEVGPDASFDAIATLACKRQLELDGAYTEAEARELVEHFGYKYEPACAQLKRAGACASGAELRTVS